ncbi:helix-turn-helix transcriptional regulator [Paenalcaligenes niemegkensis]|uniref:AraC family transcriptional regulator n=1 Tax=Paenalcaligenes niemegkensis TaxID=2895469 RepID=UPI001EE79C9A|nr:helix-turn-helix transcriptional regulator [Paenalcaligenes niemegkensis]MCQ9616230.1 helix-turn-helix transcriptional regulator [Paenalcaligenes niemegkensis]
MWNIPAEWEEGLPRPIIGNESSVANTAITEWHSHPWLQFSYALEGVIEVKTATGHYMAPPQRAVLIPAGEMHSVQASSSTIIRSLYVRAEAMNALPMRCKVLNVSPLLRELIRSFSQLPQNYPETGSPLRLAQVLLDQIQSATESGLMLVWPTDPRIVELCLRLQADAAHPQTLSDYAAETGVSVKTLSRLFLSETGISFRAWRQQRRLMHALSLLENKERVTDVALACGYESLSAFIAAFRKVMGATPTDFFQLPHQGQADDIVL